MISIQNLHAEVMARQSKRYAIYEEVFHKVISKIKYENTKTDSCYCLYKLPVWVFGVPLYNLSACAEYIINRLKEHHFQVYFTPPNILHIYWNLRPNGSNHTMLTYGQQQQPEINMNPRTMSMVDLQNAKHLTLNPTKNKQAIFDEIDKAFLETSSGILNKPSGIPHDPRFSRASNSGLTIDDLRNNKPPDLNDVLSALDTI
jgi:hypothetical protein